MVEYRYELKYVISSYSAALLKQQLKMVMGLDPHSVSQEYSYDIRSLYFDDAYSNAYYEKLNGDLFRKKYRIRIYNNSDDVIKLECKHKDADMTYKEDCTLSRKEADYLISGDYDKVDSQDKFLRQFILEAKNKALRPSVIVDYRRTAFTYPVSEVRITFDEDIRSCRYQTDMFDEELASFPVLEKGQVVLEVKYNEYIPTHIINILGNEPSLRQAVSKFALCRSIK